MSRYLMKISELAEQLDRQSLELVFLKVLESEQKDGYKIDPDKLESLMKEMIKSKKGDDVMPDYPGRPTRPRYSQDGDYDSIEDQPRQKKADKIEFNYDYVKTSIDLKRIERGLKKSGRVDVTMCLYGASGTGKSQWGKKLAHAMGLNFKKVRYSDLCSHYSGDTEKNIKKMFEEAEKHKQFLLIDEADTLLRDRTKASQGFEVSKINEMLTWLEEPKYPIVFTTNLKETIDKAMLRRFDLSIDFSLLELKEMNSMMQKYMGNKRIKLDRKGITVGDCRKVKREVEILDYKNDTKEIINAFNRVLDEKQGVQE